MPGKLDLTVAPWNDLDSSLPKAHAIYRDSPFTLALRFWTDSTKTTGRDLSGGDFEAQLRKTRLRGATSGDPLEQFAVDDTDAANGVLVISLTRSQTRDLALAAGSDAFWEIQDQTSGETLMTGKVRIYDDAGRPA